MMKTYGYVRVSTRDQNEARQMIAMEEEYCPVVINGDASGL